jgi:hypothetical protein
MRGMVPIGAIQPYAGGLGGLALGLSSGTVSVSDVQYNDNWMPCDGRALTANTFVDLFNLIGYTYSMRGTIVSQTSTASTVIRPDRGTANIASLGLAAGTIRYIRRGSNSPGVIANLAYTGGITADGTTITVAGIVTNNTNLGNNNDVVDILSPSVDSYFFAPDLRGKSPFGEYAPYGARGEAFGLSGGFTGGTANGDGGLFTNFIIRAKRDSDAMILTGHNHDSRYLRKDVSDTVSLASSTLTLQNLNVVGNIAGIASAYTGLATFNAGITSNHLYVSNGATFAGTSVHNGLATFNGATFNGLAGFNAGVTSNHLYVSKGVTFASISVYNGLATFNTGLISNHLYVSNGVTFASTSPSSSTTTGALVVAGGVGIGGSLYIGGGITATAAIYSYGNITAFSDRRLKENITNIESGLSKVVSLNGVQYTDIASQQRRTGLIAQDVLPVLPEAVHMNADGYYALAYGNMIGLLVEGIKELNAKVDHLASKVEQLSSKGSE